MFCFMGAPRLEHDAETGETVRAGTMRDLFDLEPEIIRLPWEIRPF